MPYINLTHATTHALGNYVHKNWVHSENTNFFKKHVLARGLHLTLVPSSIVTSVIDTTIGLGIGIAVLATVGKHEKMTRFAFNHVFCASKLAVFPYVNFLQAINPKIHFLSNEYGKHANFAIEAKKCMISNEGFGFTSDPFNFRLRKKASEYCDANSFFKRHVASRLTYALLALSCVVTRIADGIIGVPIAALSILTAGKFVFLNNLAYRTLQAPSIVGDLFYCTINCINPWTGTLKA
ncbi:MULTISPECIES: hypothetical protein [Parachlamydia]|jgi:hypothetical protein|uniref:hypothetical protein n=1 Tax=Parachlamydia TaxID=83551 RepID=UPI0024E276A1|nr:hypothetical protein [Parachlamydia acanthamoebae]